MFSDKPFTLQFAVAAEVEEKAYLKSRCLQVVENLGLFLSGELIERLHLNNDLPITDEVGIVFLGEAATLVVDVEWLFGLIRNPSSVQFELHGFLIYFFKKARP